MYFTLAYAERFHQINAINELKDAMGLGTSTKIETESTR